MQTHYRKIQKVLWIVLGLNALVAAAKITYGLMTGAVSMTADGFHSLADGASNLIGLVGIYLCYRPKDADHPYGHKKFETLFALGIAAMLLFVAFSLAKTGFLRFFDPVTPRVDAISFWVMVVTITINIIVLIYETRRGRALKSDILLADALHTRSDVFTSLSVIAALICVKLGFPRVDPAITLLIALFIAYSAFRIIRQEAGILCDEVAIAETARIEGVVTKIQGVKSCHNIRSRGRPDDVHLDLHIQVDGRMTMQESHRLSHSIQREIRGAFPEVVDVLVHMEPDSF